VNDGMDWIAISKTMQKSRDSVYNHWKRASVTHIAPDQASTPSDRFEMVESEDGATISSVSKTIRTVEDALVRAEIDTAIWEVFETKVNSWEVAGKRNRGQDEDKRWLGEELWTETLWQVTVKLRRKAPKSIQTGVQDLLVSLRDNPIRLSKPPRRKLRDPHMLELVLFDAHIGKRCWGQEVDGADYDLDIAEGIFINAVHELLGRVENFNIEKIIFPLGQDFFQTDNAAGETSHGTVVDSVDDRLAVVFRAGCRAVLKALYACRQVADTEVVWVPGNHDPTTSWFLCEVLAATFGTMKNPHVTIDNGPTYRKYRQYGQSLLGYTHAYDEKLRDLPLIMAAERPQMWADTKYRAWRCGHLHKKAQYSFTAGDTFNGVKVDVLPSLSGTDAWHYRKGFVKGHRTAEVYLWSRDAGYTGHFSTESIDS
jgi:hypothetical protein